MAVPRSSPNQLARQLDEAEQRFGNVFEEAPIGMALVSTDGSFLRVNRQLCEQLGYSHEQLTRLSFQELTHPDDLQADLELVEGVLAGELRTYRIDKRYYRSDGQLLWARLSVSLVRDGDEQPLYFISQIEDISERKRFEGQLQHLADHDTLTGLFNRRRFEEELARAARRRRGAATRARADRGVRRGRGDARAAAPDGRRLRQGYYLAKPGPLAELALSGTR